MKNLQETEQRTPILVSSELIETLSAYYKFNCEIRRIEQLVCNIFLKI